MAARDPKAFAREHKVLLATLFGAFFGYGIFMGSWPALLGGLGGLGWLAYQLGGRW